LSLFFWYAFTDEQDASAQVMQQQIIISFNRGIFCIYCFNNVMSYNNSGIKVFAG